MELDGRSSASGDNGLADRNNGFFSVVKRRTLTTLPSLLSDSINSLQELKRTGDTSGKKSKPLMSLSRGCVSVWLLTPLRVSKRGPPLKRTYELFGSLLTSMDSDGKNGSKSAERSSPSPLKMVGVSATRDRTALLRCSEIGVAMGRTPWLGCRSSSRSLTHVRGRGLQ